MESYLTNNMNAEGPRLASFHKYPLELPEGESRQNHKYLSPMKLARAGFYRENGLASDEVVCFSCCLKVKDWDGESPMALHRILRPDCRFLKQIYSTPPRPLLSFSQFLSPSSTQAPPNVRRELFPENTLNGSENTITERLGIMSLQDPLSSRAVNNDLMFFENHRLLTFVNPLDSLSQAWAKEGFIADLSERDLMVKCVFCGEKTSFSAVSPREIHEAISPNCPLVRYLDVGNISRELEEKVRRKYGSQPFQESEHFHRHPQFQQLEKRLETFSTWPFLQQSILPKETLAEAGFFFSGCSDKVECYSCGFGLRNWRPGANPWHQHARVRPSCLHLSQYPDQQVLQGTADAKILCDADPPKEGQLSCEGEVRSASPVQLSLPLEAVQAALACGYRLEAVRQAVHSIFLATCGYPNFALLIGKLQASEANFGLLQKQSSQIQHHQQECHIHMQELQEKDSYQQEMQSVLQEKELQVQQERLRAQEKDLQCHRIQRELAAKSAALERQRAEMWRLSAELQTQRTMQAQSHHSLTDSNSHLMEEISRQDTELVSNRQELSRNKQELSRNKQELSRKDQELSRNKQELSRNKQELSRNKQELSRNKQELSRKDQAIERLAELLQQKGIELPPLDLAPTERVATLEEDHQPQLPPSPPSSPPASPPAPQPASEATSSPPASPNGGEGVPLDLLCKVCLQEEARALFQPCRHLCCGPRCAQRLSGQPCPVCRAHINNWTLVFRA